MTKVGWNYTPEQLVFVDESACNRKMAYRERAWAIRGRRAVCKAFFVRGRRYVPQSYYNNVELKCDLHVYVLDIPSFLDYRSMESLQLTLLKALSRRKNLPASSMAFLIK
jgi:hypothetical protein